MAVPTNWDIIYHRYPRPNGMRPYNFDPSTQWTPQLRITHYELRIEQKPLIKAEKCGIINNDYYDKGR